MLLGFARATYQLSRITSNVQLKLTLMYVLVPTKVFAIELMSSPETPKSQILISPLVFARMLEGLISAHQLGHEAFDTAYLGG